MSRGVIGVQADQVDVGYIAREGRLENLADRIYLRFANRFFENERECDCDTGTTYRG